MTMTLYDISSNELQALETLTAGLLKAMKKTSLRHEVLFEDLSQLEHQLILIRRARFNLPDPTVTG